MQYETVKDLRKGDQEREMMLFTVQVLDTVLANIKNKTKLDS